MTKMIAICALLTISSFSFAADKKTRAPAATIPSEVKELASKLKREVRTRVSAYNVAEDEANACSEAGMHYNVKVQVKKAVRVLDKNENVQIKYVWETVREVDTDADGKGMEICLE